MLIQRTGQASGALALLWLVGCGPSEPEAQPAHPEVIAGSIDALYAAVAEELPGFGGAYFEDGRWVAYTAPGTRPERVQQALERAFGEPLAAELELRDGRFDFRELLAWKEAMAPALSRGAVSVDADERLNRVRVGVASAEARAAAQERSASIGAPPGAVEIWEQEPIAESASLWDRIRPVKSGLVMTRSDNVWCSTGIVSRRGAPNNDVTLVTNSHCTFTRGALDGTIYAQPLWSVTDQVATEISDPSYPRCWWNDLTTNDRCRYSDSALMSMSVPAAAAIPRPNTQGTLSITLSAPSDPNYWSYGFTEFTITSKAGAAAVGQTLQVVGAASGWRQGAVTQTCVDIGASGTRNFYYCQTLFNAGASGGDSGSPVFSWTAGAGSGSTLRGIRWGGSGAQSVYSPISGIERELGTLNPLSCGDGTCSGSESCSSCTADCGLCPFVVSASAPGLVTNKATYPLDGGANYPADTWVWERSDDGGASWYFWDGVEDSQFISYYGCYQLDWRVSARRIADGATQSARATTQVANISGCQSEPL